MVNRFFLLLGLLIFLTGCAPPETRAGPWTASTEYGDFTIYVTQDGTAISKVDYDFECGGFTTAAYDQPFRVPSETIEGRKLSISVSHSFIMVVSIEGSFNPDGEKLSGTVTFVPQKLGGGCTADFTSSR